MVRGEPVVYEDAEGFTSAVQQPGWLTPQQRFGRRVLLYAALRRGGKGYMMQCQGSGAVEGDSFQHTMRHPERLQGYGLPKGATPVGIVTHGTEAKPEQNLVKLQYMKADGTEMKWQAGAWLWREEFEIERLTREMVAAFEGSEHKAKYVEALESYLLAAEELHRMYGAFGLTSGRDSVPASDLPEVLRDIYDKVSVNIVDEYGDSSFGIHRDTPQLPWCSIFSTSVYPDGFYPVKGGGLALINGLLPVEDEAAAAEGGAPPDDGGVLLAGHRAWHTVTRLQPSDMWSRQGVPMLRASFVHWTSGGERYPSRIDYLRLNPQVPGNEWERQKLAELRDIARSLFRVSGQPPRDAEAERLMCYGPDCTLVVDGEEVAWRQGLLQSCKPERKVAR